MERLTPRHKLLLKSFDFLLRPYNSTHLTNLDKSHIAFMLDITEDLLTYLSKETAHRNSIHVPDPYTFPSELDTFKRIMGRLHKAIINAEFEHFLLIGYEVKFSKKYENPINPYDTQGSYRVALESWKKLEEKRRSINHRKKGAFGGIFVKSRSMSGKRIEDYISFESELFSDPEADVFMEVRPLSEFGEALLNADPTEERKNLIPVIDVIRYTPRRSFLKLARAIIINFLFEHACLSKLTICKHCKKLFL